ncbi:uncharacterized protein LOC143905672 [Temnothorax americanus]|uniref:uncharacterized protein LOC143905672 n=1 Tax=Temnothorax americanus TaxID=1964332 RepID=UPI004067BBFF
MRYTNEWIFECLLLRIKSSKTCKHLRAHQILSLPCIDTLNEYIKAIKGVYGFEETTFEVLKKKVKNMDPRTKHAALLLDEMKLLKSLHFDRKNLRFQGFTNLGKYTPEHQKSKKGVHALVLMFQPFLGKWVQSLACFLSKGCASEVILHKILMESIVLTEQCGLYVDVIASDGATWNRSM